MTAHELAALLLAGPDTEVVLIAREDFESVQASADMTVWREQGCTWIEAVER